MKKTISPLGQLRRLTPTDFTLVGGSLLLALLFLLPLFARAAVLKEAHVTQVVKDVTLLPGQAAPRPAAVRDEVRNGTAVRTGVDSRAELTFTDQTLTRLGSNTIFSFNEGTRNLQLSGGAMLLRVPKNAGGAKINTAAVTAAITGTTIMLEYHPDAYIKFIVLEGTGRIFRNDRIGESVLVHAGQMLIVNPKGKGLPDPVDVDVNKLMHTSLLINGFPPLPSENLIAQEINAQNRQKSEGQLITTNLAIFGRGTIVSLLDPTHSDVLDQANANETRHESPTPTATESPTPTPTATVTATGTPTPTPPITPTPPMTPTPPITPTPPMTPTPTPSITVTPTPTPSVTVTVTPTPTPTPTASAFGTPSVITSPNPYTINNTTVIRTDPSITTNGHTDDGKIYRGPADDGAPSMYFFGSTNSFDTNSGFDSHFSDSANYPLAAFKFSSLVLADNPTILLGNGGPTSLALISVGDITSGTANATLTFGGLDSLLLATQNGSITFGPNITFQGIPTLFLYARGANSTLSFDSAVTGTTNLVLLSQGDIQFNSAFSVGETDPTGVGLNLFFDAGGNLTASNGLTVLLDNTDNELTNDVDISILTGGNLTTGGEPLSLTIGNANGSIAGGASIGVFAGGNINASQIALYIDNQDGEIQGDSSIFLSAGGAIQATNDVNVFISGDQTDDGSAFGGSVYIATQAASMSVGGNFNSTISLIGSGGATSISNTVLLTGALTVDGSIGLEIVNGQYQEGYSPLGNVDNDALIELSAASISGGDYLDSFIDNSDGGYIGGDASVTVSVSGDISVSSYYDQNIFNNSFGQGSGEIDGDATVSLTANNLTADSFEMEIENYDGGYIGGDASISVNLSGDLTVTNDATFQIDTSNEGSIAGDATINVSAASLSAASLVAEIDSYEGGAVTGDSNITFTISGPLHTTGDASFEINRDSTELSPSFVSGGPSISVSAGSIDVGGSLFEGVLDGEEASGPTTNVFLQSNGSLTVGSQLTVYGTVNAEGSITAGDNILVKGGSLTSGGDITSTNGSIEIQFDNNSMAGNISAGGNISAATDIGTTFATLQAGGSISAPYIYSQTVIAGGDITLAGVDGEEVFGLQANTTTTPGNLIMTNAEYLQPYSYFEFDGSGVGYSPSDFTVSVASIQTTGPTIPVLVANGGDANSSNNSNLPDPGNGGNVTFNISAGGLSIASTESNLTSISANGGAFGTGTTGGNGGNVAINASGDVALVDGDIEATSGFLPSGTSTPTGSGGTVSIETNGEVSVNSNILVSSDDPLPSPTASPSPIRRSARGGNISLTSHKANGIGINITNSGQLLALLDNAAPGPGGTITILASGASSEVDVKGIVHADRGTIDIRHTGANGEIYLGGTANDNLDAHADIVKVGALGANGSLTIGQGTLSADSVLKLYAPGSNGQLNFIANCTLNSGTQAILAAKSITVNNSVIVNIAGDGGPAGIYTDNANYSAQNGGNGSTTGTFGGNGAAAVQPLASAPPFDETPASHHHP